MCFQWWLLKKRQKKHRTMFQVSANFILWDVIRSLCPDCTVMYVLFHYFPVSEDVQGAEAVAQSGTAICCFLDSYMSSVYFFVVVKHKWFYAWGDVAALKCFTIKVLCIKQPEALQTIRIQYVSSDPKALPPARIKAHSWGGGVEVDYKVVFRCKILILDS